MSALPITDAFANYLVKERDFSTITARFYGADLSQFVEYITRKFCLDVNREREDETLQKRRTAIQEAAGKRPVVNAGTTCPTTATEVIIHATTELLNEFVEYLKNPNEVGVKYSLTTVSRKMASLRSFFKWAERMHLTDINPMTAIRSPNLQKISPRTITIEQVEKLLAAPSQEDMFGLRDCALLQVLCHTGILVSEAAALDLEDVDIEHECLNIKGKGKRKRIVLLGAHPLSALKKYKEAVLLRGGFNEVWKKEVGRKPFFMNKYTDRLSIRSIGRKIEKYVKKAELDPTIRAHTLRLTYAATILENGADLRTLQKILGHNTILTTKTYIKVIERMASADPTQANRSLSTSGT